MQSCARLRATFVLWLVEVGLRCLSPTIENNIDFVYKGGVGRPEQLTYLPEKLFWLLSVLQIIFMTSVHYFFNSPRMLQLVVVSIMPFSRQIVTGKRIQEGFIVSSIKPNLMTFFLLYMFYP